ncbi:MAG: hypothetical protein DSY46_01410, partial [Hydrogenimonas sp.]
MKRAILLLFLFFTQIALAKTIIVDVNYDGSDPSTACLSGNTYDNSIANALKQAADGDIINICPGTYNETESILIDKDNLTLQGLGKCLNDVVINSNTTGYSIRILSQSSTSQTVLKSFTINHTASSGTAIYGDGTSNGNIILENLNINSNDKGLAFDNGFSILTNVTIVSKNRALDTSPTINTSIINSEINSTNESAIIFNSGNNIGIDINHTKISAPTDNQYGIKIIKSSNVSIDSVYIEASTGIYLSYDAHSVTIQHSILNSTTSSISNWALLVDVDSNYPATVKANCFYGTQEVKVMRSGSTFDGNYYDGVTDDGDGVIKMNDDTTKLWASGDNLADAHFVSSCQNSFALSTMMCQPNPIPIAEYRMDDCNWNGTPGEVKDSSGNGYDGVTFGHTTLNKGILCESAALLYQDTYIETNGAPTFTSYTFSAWLNIQYDGNTYHPILIKSDTPQDSFSNDDIEIYTGNGGITVSHNRSNGGTSGGTTSGRFPDNQWFLLTVSYNADTQELRIYYNGILQESAHIPAPINPPNRNFYIGKIGTYYLAGSIDEVKIFGEALSDQQIFEIYSNEKDAKNFDGQIRLCTLCPTLPACNLQNGLEFSTYDISTYRQQYPNNQDDYDSLENNFATYTYRFNKSIANTINTTGSDNNPFHPGTDNKYLTIFDGYIDINETGTYTFAVNGDDAVEVIFSDNEENISIGWYGQHRTDGTDHNANITFTKLGYYQLKFRHQDWDGDDSYQLFWKKPGDTSFSIVPNSNLFYCKPPSPVADYRMDKCSWSGDTGEVVDYSGNNYNGTAMEGAQTAIGKLCRSGLFDGVNDYIDLDNTFNDIFGPTSNQFSITAWIKPLALTTSTTNHGTKNAFIAKTSDKFNDNLEIGVNPDGSLHLYLDTKKKDTYADIGSGLTLNEWHFIAITYYNGVVKVKIDDQTFTNTTTWSGATILDQSDGSHFTIGATLNRNNYFNGYIDEVKIYNQVLTDENLQDIYDNEKNGYTYNGGSRSCPVLCPLSPVCDLQNGLEIRTYDISTYAQKYPENHTDYDLLESDYATNTNRFDKGLVNTIDTTGNNNNPFHDGTDDKYFTLFNGYLYIPLAGSYTFAVNGDDAVELILNDSEQNISIGWYGQHRTDGTDHNSTLYFSKSGYYQLKFRHQDWDGDDSYQLFWKKPGDTSFSIVPNSNLFYCK